MVVSPILDGLLVKPQGELSVAHLGVEHQAALGSGPRIVRISDDTMQKQADKHPGLGIGRYRGLPEFVATPDFVER